MSELEFVTKHRRHLHQYPELSLHEFETTKYIKEFLDNLGVEYDCPLETGAIAYLEYLRKMISTIEVKRTM